MKNILYITLISLVLFSCKEDDYPYNGYAVDNTGNLLNVVNKEAGTLTVAISSDINSGEVVPQEGVDWCTGEYANGVATLNYQANTGNIGREGEMLLKIGYHKIIIHIYQRAAGINNIEIENPTGEDTWTATTSGEQESDGGGVKSIFKIDHSSFWHSQYSPIMKELPHWIVVDLKKEQDINMVRLGWRKYGEKYYVSTKKTEIQYSTDGVNFKQTGAVIVREKTESGLSSVNYTAYSDARFEAVKARYVRLYITESNAANGTCNVAYFKVYMP